MWRCDTDCKRAITNLSRNLDDDNGMPGNKVNFGSDKNNFVDSAIESMDQFSALIQIVQYNIQKTIFKMCHFPQRS